MKVERWYLDSPSVRLNVAWDKPLAYRRTVGTARISSRGVTKGLIPTNHPYIHHHITIEAVMDHRYHHPAAMDGQHLLTQCDTQHSRASGPGGQHRNKVQTAITIRHRATGIEGAAAERRSQAQNRQKALFRLRLNLAITIRLPVDASYRPSPLWQSRCQKGRIVINPEHEDFPAILAEAMDVIAAHGMDAKPAAGQLGCTPTQLVRLLRAHPKALAWVNERRQELGLGTLC